MTSGKRIIVTIAIISVFIVIFTFLIFYSDNKISQFEDKLEGIQIQYNDRLLTLIYNQVQLSHYLSVVPFPEDYDIYGGGENIKIVTSGLNSEQKKLNPKVKELGQQFNSLKAKGTLWIPIKNILYIVTFILTLLNSFLGIIAIAKNK